MSALPPPRDTDRPLGHLVRELAGHLGEPGAVAVCVDLLGGADPSSYLGEVVYLSGLRVGPGERDAFWFRAWGARGLLHVWTDDAVPAVLAGLGDPDPGVRQAAGRALDRLGERLDLG
ncbi:HEAT repeat domain-containing protein [Nocardioides lianchengensis]|uniref:HEAT repeat domain-containing protein n=1 Tax=Nocardioides lianchengensis TaxID=1045774 RepID=UPI000B84A909|nr:HEAT repeat domain-containing protein [Nocardioides lianchengensis]NYG12892.1 HEAT repeat protein [Nocardioides lianchengensis]